MGEISPRLQKLYDVTRPGTFLPIIVTTYQPVTQATLTAARTTGARVGQSIGFGTGYKAEATQDQAKALAALASTANVQPDEPITAFPGARPQ